MAWRLDGDRGKEGSRVNTVSENFQDSHEMEESFDQSRSGQKHDFLGHLFDISRNSLSTSSRSAIANSISDTSWVPASSEPSSYTDCPTDVHGYFKPPLGRDFPPPSPPSHPVALEHLPDFDYLDTMSSPSPSTPAPQSQESQDVEMTPEEKRMAGFRTPWPPLSAKEAMNLLKDDVRSVRVYDLDLFWKHAFNYLVEDWKGIVDEVVRDDSLVATYAAQKKKFFEAKSEKLRYAPFLAIYKGVVDAMERVSGGKVAEAKWMSLNERLVDGSLVERKPDLVAVDPAFEEKKRPSWDDLHYWIEVKISPQCAGSSVQGSTGSKQAAGHNQDEPPAKAARTSHSQSSSQRSRVRASLKNRDDTRIKVEDEEAQALSYGLECLHYFVRRLSSVGVMLTDGDVRTLCLDRGGVLMSRPLAILPAEGSYEAENDEAICLRNFAEFVLATCFCANDKGFDKAWTLEPREGASTSSAEPKTRSKVPDVAGWSRKVQGSTFVTEKMVDREFGWGILSQAAKLVEGKLIDENGISTPNVVAKIAWQPINATPEGEVIRVATAQQVSGLPQVLVCDTGLTLRDLPRARILQEVEGEINEQDNRRLCIFVMPKYEPLFGTPRRTSHLERTKFRGLDNQKLIKAWKELVKAHQQLFEKARILHRDISIDNLCFDPKNSSGVLIDLNRAKQLSVADTTQQEDVSPFLSRSRFVTASIPFLAIELLDMEPSKHKACHDLESFFWMLVWILSEEEMHAYFHAKALYDAEQKQAQSPTRGTTDSRANDGGPTPPYQPLQLLFRATKFTDLVSLQSHKVSFISQPPRWLKTMEKIERSTNYPTILKVVKALRNEFVKMRDDLTHSEFLEIVEKAESS